MMPIKFMLGEMTLLKNVDLGAKIAVELMIKNNSILKTLPISKTKIKLVDMELYFYKIQI